MPPEAAQPIVVADGLHKRYGSVVALDRVSLAVQRGEFLALLGPSGCGKTTLLRIIAGLLAADGGRLTIGGQEMTRVPPNRRPVNTVFQNYALFPHMTVADNIAFGPRRLGAAAGEVPGLVREALATVGLTGFEGRYPSELSGGQQQRVALARAIVNRPQVLLLDEPLGALDLKLRKRMQLELKHIQTRLGITFVHVTHDQEEALAMADRIAVMREGRIAQLGTGEEIYRRPTSRYVADFIGEANLIDCLAEASGQVRLAATGQVLPYGIPAEGIRNLTLMVRPEAIEVGPGAEDCVNLSGQVVDKVFVGAAVRLYVRLGEGAVMAAQPRDVEAAESLAVGDSTAIHWRRDSGSLLTE